MSLAFTWLPSSVDRGPRFWLRPANWLAARRKFRCDHSLAWRRSFRAGLPSAWGGTTTQEATTYSVQLSLLASKPRGQAVRFLIVGDTGEGDYSQYATLPVVRSLEPDFMIINGDVAYPAGREEDFLHGFFEPYRDLGIPIWAVPGNHEYYSRGKGREFFHYFCSRSSTPLWETYGLRFIPQPGTFWELRDAGLGVAVIGVDTGMAGNMDGNTPQGEDREQHEWLLDRLHLAQSERLKVILLFHIPTLTGGRHKGRKGRARGVQMQASPGQGRGAPALTTLHRLIAAFSCVRLVVAAHDHNYQGYTPAVFAQYLEEQYGVRPASQAPFYVVCGGGGAYPQRPAGSQSPYAGVHFPDREQWRGYAGLFMGSKNALVSRVAAELADADDGRFLSMLLVDCQPGPPPSTTVTPVWVDDIREVLCDPALPGGSCGVIDLQASETRVPQAMLARCLHVAGQMVL